MLKSMALASAVCLLSTAVARAEPPTKGMEHVAFHTSTVMCDKPEQVKAIYDADLKDPEGGAEHTFVGYYAQMNDRGEHVCLAFRFSVAHITDVVDLGPFHGKYHAWLIVGGNDAGDGAVLYVEKVGGVQDWSINRPQNSPVKGTSI